MDRRIGKMQFSGELMRNFDIDEMLKITSKFIVVRCEYLFAEDMFEYTAISPEFDEVSPGIIPPYYLVEVKSEVLEESELPKIIEVKFIKKN